MEKEKETIELTDAALTAATGGTDEIKVEVGVRLEPSIWCEIGSGILQYNGPAKFVPSLERISVDLYAKFRALDSSIFYFYSCVGKVQQQALVFSGTPEVHSGNEPFPYPILSL